MSDTGEQGVKPQDPADKAGIGGGIVPDDQAEGYEQAAELAQNNSEDSSNDDSHDKRIEPGADR
jgi:hypothetical protein